MTFVAARTDSIRIAPNVLNVPLRPPAVVARSAASLDLLSGGRFDLALGSGGFWDAIEAMGGGRLTAGQAVTALEDAIDVIRELWDTSERRGAFTDGKYHRVHGAKRGPRPAHDVPIWIGAYKPRMLSLTGRKGDGWLPSLGYMKPGDLDRGNTAIDEAATSVGRDPRDIRRLLNVGAMEGGSWADRLAVMAIEDGISTFILAADDPRALQAFGQEVAPAVRELVRAERARRGTVAASGRSSVAIAARRSGIAYDDVPAGLRAIEPGDFAYENVRATYMRGGAPGIVLQPDSTAQVADAIAFARAASGCRALTAQRRPRDQRPQHERRRNRHRPAEPQRDRGARRGAPAGADRTRRALGGSRGGARGARLGDLVRRLGRRRRRGTRDRRRHRLPRSRARPHHRPPACGRARARRRIDRADGCRDPARPLLGRARRGVEHRDRDGVRVRGRGGRRPRLGAARVPGRRHGRVPGRVRRNRRGRTARPHRVPHDGRAPRQRPARSRRSRRWWTPTTPTRSSIGSSRSPNSPHSRSSRCRSRPTPACSRTPTSVRTAAPVSRTRARRSSRTSRPRSPRRRSGCWTPATPTSSRCGRSAARSPMSRSTRPRTPIVRRTSRSSRSA